MDYAVSPESLALSKIVSGQGDDVVEYRYDTGLLYNENNECIDVIHIEAQVSIEDTTFEGYSKMVVITYENLTRTFYIVYSM